MKEEQEKNNKQTQSRRDFVKTGAMAAAAFMIVPRHVLGRGFVAPSDRLLIASIGVGGKGQSDIAMFDKSGKANISFLCDVDERRAARTVNAFPKAKYYKDWREMFDKEHKNFDAVSVATPDHNHAIQTLAAMQLGKHVYVQKPLTHDIYEARILTEAAKKYKVVTQMGNQGASNDGTRIMKEWYEAGLIGDVHTVNVWTDRPVWPQGIAWPGTKSSIPKELDWDLWLGPAKMRPYNENYLPFKWRGFWDFGTGAMGDMGCHIMETPFKALELGFPYEAEASCTTIWSGDFVEADYSEACPPSSVVRLKFNTEKHDDLSLNWYDGGIMPDLPEELADGEIPGGNGGGSIFHGSDGIMVTDTYSGNPRLLPSERMHHFLPPQPTLPRVTTTHQGEWVEAILSGTGKTSSPFSYGGPLTEAVLMGNLAIKAYQYKTLKEGKKVGDWDPYNYPGRKNILWDGANMKVTNWEEANRWVKRDYRAGWEL